MLKGTAVAALGLAGGALVPGVRGQELPNEITISSGGGTIQYAFSVSGELEPGPQATSEDVVSGNQAEGAVGVPGTDDFRFSGDVTGFSSSGPAVVTINGEEVEDPTGLPGGSDDGSGGSDRGDGSGSGEQSARPVGVVEQGDSCTPLVPLTGEGQSVSEFYGYTTDESADGEPYEANTPSNISRPDTSYVFLYRADDGLSLVFIHGGGEKGQGGAASFDITGLPGDGEWAVRDDGYEEDPDTWNVGSSRARIDWSWNQYHGDGGAFSGLGDEFEITIEPSFNGAASLDPLAPGEITNWRAITIDGDGERVGIDLALDRPITIRSGSC